ncbi:L,D-transpeptidase [Cumulibacter manganitolerans]|uniref:L,D-transpeptidase n=1 Tax=Cumulibacter manganitolerans TaxID=1884992 RepID=UPI001E527102|nr:L,D-transpeptidase [Cumulibacter manganitolerans]
MKGTLIGSARGLFTTVLSALLVVAYAGSAGASGFDLTLTATGVATDYAPTSTLGSARYTLTVHNPTAVAEPVSTQVTPALPDGAAVTGVTATAVTVGGADKPVQAGHPTGGAYLVDEATVPAGETYTYTVTVAYSYQGTPTALNCAAGGGLRIDAALLVGGATGASATACLEAPAPVDATSTAPDTASGSSSSSDASSGSSSSSSSAAPSESPTATATPTPESPKPAPSASATTEPSPALDAQPKTTSAGWNDNPVGTFGSWVNSDGLIYFTGWAYDPSDMSQAPITMWTMDGSVVAYQAATLASPDLYPYGVYNRGVFGALRAPNPGQHSVCMFVINIGPGASQLVKCLDVNVPNADPTGDIGTALLGNGDIYVGGYAYDPSDPYAKTVVWITDNGSVAGAFYAQAPGTDLSAYGVPGWHGIDYRFSPSTYGNHQVCLYVHNIGWGKGTWPKCTTVTINPDAYRDNPRGDFNVTGNQGAIGVGGWAYDPNQWGVATQTMWTVDGNAVGFANANQPQPGVNMYLGVSGNHGVNVGLPASVGWHTVCMYVVNVGLGATQMTKCTNVNVVAPPNPCPAYAKACVDLTHSTTWLQSNGQIYYGPVKQIAGRAGYRTPTGTFKVYWKDIDHLSSEFGGAPMPYSIFFVGGVAFHVGSLTTPSHGCIHLSWEAAKVYWDQLQVGDVVYVFGSAPY